MKALGKILPLVVYAVSSLPIYGAYRNYFMIENYDLETGLPHNLDSDYYDDISRRKSLAELTLDEWFKGPAALGSWFGARTIMENNGFAPVVTYLGNFAANPSGGRARGASNTSCFNLGFGLDLAKATGLESLEGWSVINTWVWRFGDSLTNEYIGNAFNVQQNFGSQTMRLQSAALVYNANIADFNIMFKFGRIAAGDNFMSKPIYWLYQNNAFDGNPVGVFKQTKFSAYPGSTWGAFAQIRSPDGKYFKTGVYQINTDEQDSPHKHGLDMSFRGIGVNATFEAGWDINHDDSGKSPGNISAGFVADWYNAPHNDNPSAYSDFNYTVYFQADYMIWNMGYTKTKKPTYIPRKYDSYRDIRGLVAWAVFQYDPNENLAEMPIFVNGGLLFNAPFASRADDVICFGVAYGKYSDDLPAPRAGSYEAIFEINYKFQINRFAFIQPNLQYVLNTGGGAYPDAVVLGIQYGMSF